MRKHESFAHYVMPGGTINTELVVIDFCRVLENRAPQLGAAFREFIHLHSELKKGLVEYIRMEFCYWVRAASTFERECANEVFRIALIGVGGASFYLAVRNCVHSMASAMARAVLAADVNEAFGGENNAD